MNEECVARVDNVTTCIAGETIHRDISFCLYRGEILGIVGGSGSGKTTLLREMIGLRQPDYGSVTVFGETPGAGEGPSNTMRERCGVLFQGGALFTALTVFENVALPMRELRQLDEDMITRLVCLKLDMVGLQPHDGHRTPAELSGGMVKRAALARALALEPELLFLDEPTSGLDPIARDSFVELLAGLRKELGLTAVMVSHDLETLLALCDRIAVLADQTLVAIGPPDEVRRDPHPFIQHFFTIAPGKETAEAGA